MEIESEDIGGVGSESTITRHVISIDPNDPEAVQVVFCGYHRTDGGNAQRLIAVHGDKIRYCDELKTWFVWDGVKWAADTTLTIQEYAKDTARLIHSEVALMVIKGATKAEREAVSKWAFASEEQRRINAMIKNAQSDPRVSIRANELDANLMLINCPNGTLDLDRREFREHRREDLLTMVTSAPYPVDLTQESGLFFPTLLKALTPAEAIYAQRMLGSFLEHTTQNKEWLFVFGLPFAMKSSVTQAVYAALGDYAQAFPIELLIRSRHGVASNAPRPELIALQKVRIAWTEEAPANFNIDDSMLKSLTSSGKKGARGLWEKSHNIELGCSFVVESNGTFNIDIESQENRDAAIERTKVLKFINSLPPEERDPEVLKRITHDEAELSAALAWVTQGYFDRKDFGLETPAIIDETKEAFEAEINPLSSFIKNEIEFAVDEWVLIKDLWQRFQDTSSAEVLKSFKGSRSFSIQLKKVLPHYAKEAGVSGVKSERMHEGRAWLNMRLINREDYAEDNDEGPAHESVTQTCSCDSKQAFGYSLSHVIQYYTKIHQNGVLRHQPTFPTILVEGTKPVELDFLTIGEHSDEMMICDDNYAVEPLREADFNGFILKRLEWLAKGDKEYRPEALCNVTVESYCEDHNISGDDRQSRIKVARHFSDLVNGTTPTAEIFLRLTGGKPLLLEGDESDDE